MKLHLLSFAMIILMAISFQAKSAVWDGDVDSAENTRNENSSKVRSYRRNPHKFDLTFGQSRSDLYYYNRRDRSLYNGNRVRYDYSFRNRYRYSYGYRALRNYCP